MELKLTERMKNMLTNRKKSKTLIFLLTISDALGRSSLPEKDCLLCGTVVPLSPDTGPVKLQWVRSNSQQLANEIKVNLKSKNIFQVHVSLQHLNHGNSVHFILN